MESSDPTQEAACRPRVVVSACLLGEKVRYDGSDRRLPWLTEILSGHCGLQPICPEMEAGLGVPRPPVRLLREPSGEIRVQGVNDPDLDVTDRLQDACRSLLDRFDGVDGVILKSRSPSCAVDDAPCPGPDDGEARCPGLFARMCRQRYPDLPLIDERGLASEAGKVGFLIQVFRYRCRRLRPSADPAEWPLPDKA